MKVIFIVVFLISQIHHSFVAGNESYTYKPEVKIYYSQAEAEGALTNNEEFRKIYKYNLETKELEEIEYKVIRNIKFIEEAQNEH